MGLPYPALGLPSLAMDIYSAGLLNSATDIYCTRLRCSVTTSVNTGLDEDLT